MCIRDRIRCAKNGVKSHVAAITITDQPHVMRVAFFTPSFTCLLYTSKLSVNMTRYELRVNGQVLDTPPKELELLFHLSLIHI